MMAVRITSHKVGYKQPATLVFPERIYNCINALYGVIGRICREQPEPESFESAGHE